MRISGLSSGMDTEQMIKDIMTAQRIPVDRVFQQKVKAEWKRDAYRDVNTKLLRFRNLAFDMALQGTFQKNIASSSHTNIISVNATGRAQSGSYELKVGKLAEAAQFVAHEVNWNESPSSFQIQGLDGETMVKIEIGEEDTLGDIAAKINANKELGISAFAHGDSISFTTKATGAEAKFVVDQDFRNLFGAGIDDVTGQDAELTINGLEVRQKSNTFDLNGITVNLLEASPDTTVRVEVRHDLDGVVAKIKEFANLYNELVDEFNLSTREEVFRDFQPLTTEQKESMSEKDIELWEEKAKSGLLRSDPLLSRVLSEMRIALGGTVEGLEGNKSLSQIGITTGSWYEYGRLNIDEEKLRAALQEDPENVRDIFTKQSESEAQQGLARRLAAALDSSMERITGTAGKASITYDQSALGNQIRNYESRLSAMEERLIRYEESQWKKFTVMEKVLSQLYAQSDWLYQQLMTMQG